MKDDNCIFCKLANGDIPTRMIYEDEMFAVIMDASPATRGHSLILPKEHYANIYELPDEIWERPWIKVLIIGHKQELDDFEPIYRREYDSGCSVRSGDHFLDIVATGASKGEGLKQLAALLGIESGDIYAVGDNMNDIDMLRVAGHSYAVANAEDAVKAAARHSAPSCDDDAIAYIVNEADKGA